MRRFLRTTALAAMAFARQAVLLPRDTGAPVVPRGLGPREPVVVFMHGLFASAGVLRPMRERVERALGVRTATLSYLTGPSATELAARLGALVDALPRDAPLHLVGHSMGGVVTRYYAVKLAPHRVRSTIALASPFGGIRGLGALPFDGARDLAENSPILRELRLARPPRPVPHLSIIAGSDALVSSPAAHALPDGEVHVLPDRGHNTVLFDDEAIALVIRTLRASLARDADAAQETEEAPTRGASSCDEPA